MSCTTHMNESCHTHTQSFADRGYMEYGGGRSKTQRVDFVQHHGYVSLFPFLLDVLPETFGADKMAAIIDVVKSEKYLMSKAGLRSLFLDVHGERERETARDYVYTYLLLYYIYMYTHTHIYIYVYGIQDSILSLTHTHTQVALSHSARGRARCCLRLARRLLARQGVDQYQLSRARGPAPTHTHSRTHRPRRSRYIPHSARQSHRHHYCIV